MQARQRVQRIESMVVSRQREAMQRTERVERQEQKIRDERIQKTAAGLAR